MTVTYTYTREWRTADDLHMRRIVTTVHAVAATAANRPVDADVRLLAWDRAGLPTVAFGHAPTRTADDRLLVWDDYANPDEYWADGRLWQWHTDLVTRLSPHAVVCLVTGGEDRLEWCPAWSLTSFDATGRAVNADGARAIGLAAVSPETVADPADWYPGLPVCEDMLHRAIQRMAAWCVGTIYEVRQRVDGGDETIVFTSYSDDADWAATQARLVADRHAELTGERSRTVAN